MKLKINETKTHEAGADWILHWLLRPWLLCWRVSPRPAVRAHLWWCTLLDAQ